MDFIQRLVHYFAVVRRQMRRHRRLVVTCAAVVVFATTYALILPAITLDENTASDEPGIELATASDEQAEAENDGEAAEASATEDTATEAEPAEGQDATPAEADATEPAQSTEAVSATGDATAPKAAKLDAKTDDGTYAATVSYGEDAGLGDGTQLRVAELDPDSDAYKSAYQKVVDAKTAAGETVDESALGFKAFDISILDAQGNEVEPADGAKVAVKLNLKSLAEGVDTNTLKGSLQVQHIKDGETDPRKAVDTVAVADAPTDDSKIDVSGTDATAEFKTDSFSTYVVTWSSAEQGSNLNLDDLNDKTFVVVDGTHNAALTSAVQVNNNNNKRLAAVSASVGIVPATGDDGKAQSKNVITFADGTDVNTVYWKFTKVDESTNQFYVESVNQDGTSKSPALYLNVSGSGVTTSSTQQALRVETSDNHAGTVRIASSTDRNGDTYYAVNPWNGTPSSSGFGAYTDGSKDNSNEWFTLYSTETTEFVAPQLTTVETVDSTAAGITMRMIDYSDTEQGKYKIGGNYTGPVHQGLLSRVLTNGYPTTTGGTSLSGLFYGGTSVNHLFIKSTYDSTGYYEYSSFQNYAYLGSGTNFTVYDQIGTPDNQDYSWYRRGNFMPYNQIVAGGYSDNTNDYDENGNALSDDDPRKGEVLYKTQGTNDYHFGMYLEANFVQMRDGKVNGEDMVYQFNGDDDLWVYIDGVLVLDIGGIHDAHSGSIDFASGVVTVNTGNGTVTTNIKDQFQAAGVFPDGSKWDDSKVDDYFKGDTFKDYSAHNMKMFYMERGAGASNLHMRFNLPVIPAGSFDVSKQLSNTDKENYANVQFAYQAFKKNSDGTETALKNATYTSSNTSGKSAGDAVEFQSATFGGTTYDNVFYLKPGETVRFSEDGLHVSDTYYVREIGVRSDEYDQVTINGTDITQEGESTDTYKSYRTTDATVASRPLVTFTNNISAANKRELHIKKNMEQGSTAESNVTFSFNIKLEETDGTLANYSGPYYLVDESGNYYVKGEDGSITNNGATAVVCGQVGTDGIVSGVPAGYEVVITQILSGTQYRVTEVGVPDGYEFASISVSDVAGTTASSYHSDSATTGNDESSNHYAQGEIVLSRDSQVVVTNRRQAKKVKLVKVDARNTETTLSGATFTLKQGESDVSSDYLITSGNDGVFSGTTNDGVQTASEVALPYGTYTLEETAAPDGYNLNNKDYTITVGASDITVLPAAPQDEKGNYTDNASTLGAIVSVSGDVTTVKIPDNPEPKVHIVKTSDESDTSQRTKLSGVTFRLTRGSDAMSISGKTGDNGSFTISDANGFDLGTLPDGTYTLTEVSAPSGYIVSNSEVTFTITNGIPSLDTTGGKNSNAGLEQPDKDGGTDYYTLYITNTPGKALPETGGDGTLPFALAGSGLMALAIVGLALRRRSEGGGVR